eukprot:scaffold501_cov145-Skeletonema_menzelii.AAC.1
MESADHHCFEDDDGAAANLCQSYATAESSKNTTADCSDGVIIGLNAWIDAAIQALKTSSTTTGNSNQNQHKNVVCSREYLSCALKIAHSLADQLCVVDVKKEVTSPTVDEEGGGIALDPSILNEIMAGPHQRLWQQQRYESLAHSIYVRCGAKLGHEEKQDDGCRAPSFLIDNHEPFPLHCDQSSDETDDLNISSQKLSSLLESGEDHYDIEYLNVKRATLREIIVRDICIIDDRRTVAIQALGATFFQLFSGGQQVMEVLDDTLAEPSMEMGMAEGYDRLDHMSKKTQRTSPSSTVSSVEPLKSLGLPIALCDLISNMVDCASNGGVTDDESYEVMKDVRDDLKLMMDSPEIYLRDLDLTHASNVDLQMESIGCKDGRTSLYGRESELEMLKESYQRSISSGYEVAMIYGSSGIGKSTLSNNFAEYVTAGRAGSGGSGVFLSGCFDKLQQLQPFQAISSAFDEYCTWLAARDETK